MKPKVLHVIFSESAGGIQKLVADLAKFSDSSKFDVSILTILEDKNWIFKEEIEKAGIKIYSTGISISQGNSPNKLKRYFYQIKAIIRTWKLLKSLKPTIIHTHSEALIITFIPLILTKIPIKVHTIHSIIKGPGLLSLQILTHLEKIGIKFLNIIPVAVSKDIAKKARIAYKIPKDPLVIYNGIDVEKFLVKKPKIKRGKLILINVGRFEDQKNHKLLIEAFSEAIKKFPKLELWLVGNGSLKPKIEQLVEQKYLTKKVKFLGIRKDVNKLLSQSDIFVLSSKWESFGIVLVEAMAAGVPIISTDVNVTDEILEKGKAGIIVPNQDERKLSEAIVSLAKDINKRKHLSKHGQEVAIKKFDIRKSVKEYEKVYSSLLKGNFTQRDK